MKIDKTTPSIHCSDAFLTLAAAEFDPIVAFYQALLGRSPTSHIPNVYAEFQLPGLRLAIFKPKSDHEAEFSQPTRSGFSLCLEVADLEGAIAHLTAIGHPPTGAIVTASHGRELYAYDPAGNRLILHQSH
ncbi:MAG: VOC family protein [Synechococcales bacterium]|nr:VOC family protein [Synechococcales bacterium]